MTEEATPMSKTLEHADPGDNEHAALHIGARVRVLLGRDVVIGPGKADVLQAVREHGSIAAAGRQLGMGYKRVWLLVDSMNQCFVSPLIEASKGGARGGGARLTPLGEEVLARYRNMERLATAAIAAEVAELQRAMLRPLGGDLPR